MSRQYLEKLKEIIKVDMIHLLYLTQASANQTNFDCKNVYKHNLHHEQTNISIGSLIDKFPDCLISRILLKIRKALDFIPKENEYPLIKISENKLKLISTSFKTLEYFMTFEAIPFRVLNFTEESEDTVSVIFDNEFLTQIDKSLNLIKISEKNHKQQSSIIIQNQATPASSAHYPPTNPMPNPNLPTDGSYSNPTTNAASSQGVQANPQSKYQYSH